MAVPAFLVLLVAIRLVVPDALGDGLVATLVLMLGASFANQTRAVFYAAGVLRYEAITTIGETLVLFAGVVVCATMHLHWTAYIWAYAISWWFTVAFSGVVAVVRLGHRFRFDLQYARLSMLARESLPFALSFIISTLYYKIDQPLIKVFGVTLGGLDARAALVAVGLYAAAYKFLDAATFVPQALMDPIYPALSRIYHETPDRLGSVATKAYKMLMVAAVPTAVTLVVLADPILRYGAGPDYVGPGHDGVPIMQVLGVSVLFLFVNNTFIYTLNAMGRQSESTRLAVLSLVVNVGLNLVLIPQASPIFGRAMGAAWATVLTEVALFIGGYALLRRHLFALPLARSVARVVPAAVLCAGVMYGTQALLPRTLWAAAVALVAGGLAYAAMLLAARAFTPDEIALAREGLLSRTGR